MFDKKSHLVELVPTTVAIYHLQTNFLGVMKQNKKITRMPIRCDNKHDLSFSYLG